MSTQHLWLPYSQMQTAPEPLLVERTDGVRLHLADGRDADRRHRVVVDGVSRLQPSAHPRGGAGAARAHAACDARRARARAGAHVRAPARGAPARRPRARVLHRVRLRRGRSRDEDRAAVPLQSRRARAHAVSSRSSTRITATRWPRCRSAIRRRACIGCSATRSLARSSRRCRPIGESASRFRALGRRARGRADGDHRRAARAGGRRHEVPLARDAREDRDGRAPLRSAADPRRDRDRLRPHGHAVRVRASRRRARPDHAVEGAHGRHAAARGDGRRDARLRRFLERRSHARVDARADVRGQSARVRGRERVARSVRARAAPRPGGRDRAPSCATGSRRAAA